MGGSDGRVFYTPVTTAELWKGMRPGEEERVELVLGAMTCIPLNDEVGRVAGHYLRHFARSHDLQLPDALIAATATVHAHTLWTRNRKHYPMKDIVHFAGI